VNSPVGGNSGRVFNSRPGNEKTRAGLPPTGRAAKLTGPASGHSSDGLTTNGTSSAPIGITPRSPNQRDAPRSFAYNALPATQALTVTTTAGREWRYTWATRCRITPPPISSQARTNSCSVQGHGWRVLRGRG